jgi:serine/threonine protein kinase
MQEDEWLEKAMILASLNHPNIVKFICCNKYEKKYIRGHFIAMEQMDTKLGSLIKRFKE